MNKTYDFNFSLTAVTRSIIFYSVKLLHPYLYLGYHRGQSRVLFVVSKFTAVTPLYQIKKFLIKNQNFEFELIQIWFFGLISFSVLALFFHSPISIQLFYCTVLVMDFKRVEIRLSPRDKIRNFRDYKCLSKFQIF